MRFFTLLVVFLCLALSSRATHIVGGEMIYTYLGNDLYKITIKLYRDCSPGVSGQYPSEIHLAVYDTAGVLQQQLDIPFPGTIILPNTANNPCLIVPPNVCVQEAVYVI